MLLEEADRFSINVNTAVKICMTVGYDDAQLISKEFAEQFLPRTYQDCARFHGYLRMPHFEGSLEFPSTPRQVKFFGPPKRYGTAQKLIKYSQENHARPKEKIAADIRRFLGTSFNPPLRKRQA
jgi:hypothetical protein